MSFEVRFTPDSPAYLVAQGCGGGIVTQFARDKGRDPQEELGENAAYRAAILDEYRRRTIHHFDMMSAHLPSSCSRFLDIGCGLGLLSLFVWRWYEACGDPPMACLLDGHMSPHELREIDRPGGFHSETAGYRFCSSVFEAEKLLESNGDDQFTALRAPAASPRSVKDLDLIYSRRSWGFHYPVDAYAAQVSQALSPDGRVIVDVRSETDEMSTLRRHFGNCEVIEKGELHQTVLASDPK